MIAERAFPQTVAALRSFASDRCGEAETVTLQGGHFLLLQPDEASDVRPWIGDGNDPERQADAADFPLMTWQLGLELLGATRASRRYISTLVNDWQYVASDGGRQQFYREFGKLPQTYEEMLRAAEGVRLLVPRRPRKGLHTGDFFSEQTLRNQYRRHVKRLLRSGTVPAAFSVENDPVTNACVVKAGASDETVYCTGQPQNCTHEVAQFVYAIGSLTAADVLINIYPIVCRDHVEAGTEIGLSLFKAAVGKIINVGIPSGTRVSADEAIKGGSVSVHVP